jgi:signal transduction histidine kinase
MVAAIWSSLALALTGWGLSAIFRSSVEAAFDRQISVSIDALAASVNVDADGALTIDRPPTDPRFSRPLSGYYWRVADLLPNKELSAGNQVKSRSLFDETLSIPNQYINLGLENFGATDARDMLRGTELLRIGYRVIKLPDREFASIIIVAADRSEIYDASQRFNLVLIGSLILLAIGLIFAIILQVRLGLEPVRRIGAELAEIRNGDRSRLDDFLPIELAPLARELNALLTHNQEVVERARTQVGNLAHALKTPISVLLNESRESADGFGSLVFRQTQTMQRQVDHYLKRAQAVARAESIRARTPIMQVVEDIVRTLTKLYSSDGVSLRIVGDTAAIFRGDQEDLEDLVGNLAENACKYGGGAVEISFSYPQNGKIEIVIDDDGDGLTKSEINSALKRGVRLDETSHGSGLGLSIADELARAYGGFLLLEASPLGGLRVNLQLPIIET